MKVEINVEKMHVYMIMALIVVLFGLGLVIALGTPGNPGTTPNPGHDLSEISGELTIAQIPNLPADKITSGAMTGPITVNGDLTVGGAIKGGFKSCVKKISAASKNAIVNCDSGYRVIGGGCLFNGLPSSLNQDTLVDARPLSSGQGWICTLASEFTGSPADTLAFASAICCPE